MPRPATIACRRCNEQVTVRGRGPVPTYCAGCRSQPKRDGEPRPVSIACRNCGAQVEVKSRGPLPKQCRGKCQPGANQLPDRIRHHDHRTTESPAPRSARPSRAGIKRRPQPAERQTAGPAGFANEVQITRLDSATGAQRMPTPNHRLHVRLSRIRHALSIGLWLLAVLAMVLIFLLGSQPAPPELETFTP